MRAQALAAVCVLIGGLGLAPARADERPLDLLELDKRLAKAAHDASLEGAALWNAGNLEGCFRLYQGSLTAIHPFLVHHPKLADQVQTQLDAARELKPAEGAFALRKALDAVQKETADALAPESTWKRLRGEVGVRAIARDFLLGVAADPQVNLTRGGQFKFDARALDRLEQVLVEQISADAGGPLKVDAAAARTALNGLKLTETGFDVAAAQMAAVLKEYQVSDDDAKVVLDALAKLKPQVVPPKKMD